jgi:hypothetical protein
MLMKRFAAFVAALAALFTWTETSVASPPDPESLERVLLCDVGELRTRLTPGGFGTPFTVIGTNDKIIPKHVTVTTGGVTFVTIDVPGFDPDRPDAIACSYTDPVGLFVEFIGLLAAD